MKGPRIGAEQLHVAARAIDAPDVVLACSEDGERLFATAGTAPTDGATRQNLRYETGSVSKTFTGLLLAQLAHHQALDLTVPLARHLPGSAPPHGHRDAITPYSLITHTSGLPRLPRDLYPRALRDRHTNPYARYTRGQLLAAFRRSRPRRAPGLRWHYSNFGVALLAPALEDATGTPFADLMGEHVLGPLRLSGTGLAAEGPRRDALGHGRDGLAVVPPFDPGAFLAAGAVRATPGDLLGYLEAHLRPERCPPLRAALHAVRRPLLRRGSGPRQTTHTLTWFSHPTEHGTLYFHSGATPGQEVFLGFRPATGTALAAVANRRHTRAGTLQQQAYGLFE